MDDFERLELKNLKARLEDDEKMAEVGFASYGAAHSLNNTLAAILGFVEIALQDEMLPPETKKDLEYIRVSALSGKRILAELGRLARKGKANFVPCRVHEIIESVLASSPGLLEQGRNRLRLELGSESPTVMGNSTHLQRLLRSMIDRMIRQKNDRSVLTLKSAVEDSGFKGYQVRITVENDGSLLPQEMTDDPVCAAIAMQHGGRLMVENRPEGGARFALYLPVRGGRPA